MLTRRSYTWHAYLLAATSIQLLTSFIQLSAMEMPLELMHESINVPKSIDYPHRMAFPLAAATDVSAEVPPNVEAFDFTPTSGSSDEHEDLEGDATARPGFSQWLQLQQGHGHQSQSDQVNYHTAMQQKHKHSMHHHANRQGHTSTTSPVSSPLRRCSIEISSKIPGICQSMGSIGNACVSGDYIDVFNVECL